MKILIANMYYAPNLMGGAEYSVKLLAEQLASLGHEVNVVTLDGEKKKSGKPEAQGKVTVYRFYDKSIYTRRILGDKSKKYQKVMNGLHSLKNPKLDLKLKKLLKKLKPDVIHTNNLVSMSYGIWEIANELNIPVVHTLRDYWLLDPRTVFDENPGLAIQLFRNYTRNKTNNSPILVTAPSESTLKIFANFNYFQYQYAQCVPNALNFDNAKLEKATSQKQKREGPVTFIFAGTLTENKGIHILVEAFQRANTDAKLVICGEGPLEDWIKEKSKNVELKGKLKQEDLFKEYEKADVLVAPSLWAEPFGRIVLEAVQYGMPVIGSDAGGIPETIRHLNCGSIYEARDVDALTALIKAYSNREILKDYLAHPPVNTDDYSLERQADSFLELYRKAAENLRP